MKLALRAAAFAAALWLTPAMASAQSVTDGGLAGSVLDRTGAPLADVSVQLVRGTGAAQYESATGRDGGYEFGFVRPGRYTLRVERLGYRPLHVTGVPIRPARRVALNVALEGLAEGPVAVDTVVFADALAEASRPGTSRAFGPLESRLTAPREGGAGDLLRLSSLAHEPLAVEGLPPGYSTLVVDGVPFQPAAPAHTDGAPAATALLPVEATAQPELLAGRLNLEWPAAAGGLLTTLTERGGEGFGGTVYGSYGPSALALDEGPAGIDDFGSWRAGAAFGGSFANDSAHLHVFGHGSRVRVPVAILPSDSATLDALAAVYGVDGAALLAPEARSSERFNGGGRFDWRFAQDQKLEVSALFGSVGGNRLPRPALPGEEPGALDGTDFLATAAVRSRLAERVSAAVRFGMGRSTRELAAAAGSQLTGLPSGASVVVSDALLGVGASPIAAGDASRTDFWGQSTFYLDLGRHEVGVGIGGRFTQHERQSPLAQAGVRTFGSADDVAAGAGAFFQTLGPSAAADFSTEEIFAFVQDAWRVAPGLDLISGLRGELETLPGDDIAGDADWLAATGLDNSAAPTDALALGAMLGFDWNVGERHDWLLRGGVTVVPGDVGPGLLAEALTRDGTGSVRRGLGDLAAPDAFPTFRTLTLLGDDVRAPLTTRASLGIARALDDQTALLLSGVLRRTENLPRRFDLNLPVQPSAVDQHGRPIYGQLERVGGIVAATPGSNRRFSDYDLVQAVATDGASRYWGVTAAVERRAARWLDLAASYTYSRTTDDVGGAGTWPGATIAPFQGHETLADWADGTSDLDRPHRLAVAAEATLPVLAGLRLGAAYSYESGAPFTPGLPPGVDLNGDGVAGNDPAFIDATIAGVPETAGDWACLGEHNEEFVERNACRLPARQGLDLRLGLGLVSRTGFGAELLIEALDVASQGGGWYDTALYRVDAEAPADLDPADGRVVVPLAVNPRFGERIIEPSTLGTVRAGIRVRF